MLNNIQGGVKMAVKIELDTDIDQEIEKIKELVKNLDAIKEKAKLIHFISIKEFAEITGWRRTNCTRII